MLSRVRVESGPSEMSQSRVRVKNLSRAQPWLLVTVMIARHVSRLGVLRRPVPGQCTIILPSAIIILYATQFKTLGWSIGKLRQTRGKTPLTSQFTHTYYNITYIGYNVIRDILVHTVEATYLTANTGPATRPNVSGFQGESVFQAA